MRWIKTFSSVCLCAGLLGCATTPPAPDMVTMCLPEPKAYTAAQEAEAAKELRSLGENSELGVFMADYAGIRAAALACVVSQHK